MGEYHEKAYLLTQQPHIVTADELDDLNIRIDESVGKMLAYKMHSPHPHKKELKQREREKELRASYTNKGSSAKTRKTVEIPGIEPKPWHPMAKPDYVPRKMTAIQRAAARGDFSQRSQQAAGQPGFVSKYGKSDIQAGLTGDPWTDAVVSEPPALAESQKKQSAAEKEAAAAAAEAFLAWQPGDAKVGSSPVAATPVEMETLAA